MKLADLEVLFSTKQYSFPYQIDGNITRRIASITRPCESIFNTDLRVALLWDQEAQLLLDRMQDQHDALLVRHLRAPNLDPLLVLRLDGKIRVTSHAHFKSSLQKTIARAK